MDWYKKSKRTFELFNRLIVTLENLEKRERNLLQEALQRTLISRYYYARFNWIRALYLQEYPEDKEKLVLENENNASKKRSGNHHVILRILLEKNFYAYNLTKLLRSLHELRKTADYDVYNELSTDILDRAKNLYEKIKEEWYKKNYYRKRY